MGGQRRKARLRKMAGVDIGVADENGKRKAKRFGVSPSQARFKTKPNLEASGMLTSYCVQVNKVRTCVKGGSVGDGGTVNYANAAHEHPCPIINHQGSLISPLSEDTITSSKGTWCQTRELHSPQVGGGAQRQAIWTLKQGTPPAAPQTASIVRRMTGAAVPTRCPRHSCGSSLLQHQFSRDMFSLPASPCSCINSIPLWQKGIVHFQVGISEDRHHTRQQRRAIER
jgi:hypothetical protein